MEGGEWSMQQGKKVNRRIAKWEDAAMVFVDNLTEFTRVY